MSLRIKSVQDVSVSASGIQGNGDCGENVLSSDGRFDAFVSLSSNLVGGDTDTKGDVFVFDRTGNSIQAVSFSVYPGPPYFGVSNVAMSGDGRFVSFNANYIQNGFTSSHVYIYDKNTGQATSLGSGGASVISTNGQAVVFERPANGTQIEIDGTNGGVLASLFGNANLWNPAVSGDGRFVTFYSAATQISDGSGAVLNIDPTPYRNAFIYDRISRSLDLVSKGLLGSSANGDSGSASQSGDFATDAAMSVSGDGRYVAFESSASNLVANDTNSKTDIFVYDKTTKTTERVSLGTAGINADGNSIHPSVSADGRYVAFQSSADNLVANDTNGVDDIFVYDRQTHTTIRVSVAADGTQANGSSFVPVLSADGTHVSFTTSATNLFANDTNNHTDVVVVELTNGGGITSDPSDIIWSKGQQIGEWTMSNNSPTWSLLSSNTNGWSVVGHGDYNGDGGRDVLWYNAQTQQLGDWTGNLNNPSWTLLSSSNSGWTVVGSGDYNGDGTSDILLFNAQSKQLGDWTMTSNHSTWNLLSTNTNGWTVAGNGDYNGDGTSDILWFNAQTRQLGEWTMSGNNPTWNLLSNNTNGWSVVGNGDYNGDGKSDVLWYNAGSHQLGEWTNVGITNSWTSLSTNTNGWTVVGSGDYNGDGTDDVLWYNVTSQQLGDWLMNANDPTHPVWNLLTNNTGGWNVTGGQT